MSTPVIFRKWPKKEGGDVIALFPTLVGNMDPYTCTSYMQIGQHSSADPQEVVWATKPAKPAEYADLLEELKSIGYDDLVVYQKLQYRWIDERRKTLAEYSQPASPTKKHKQSKSRGKSSRGASPSLRGVR
jgi:hypothetical protein